MVEFRNNGIIMAAGDHALRIEFIGANFVTPEANYDGESLEKVVYKELWDKIDLVYEKTGKGTVKSSYVVAPGGDPLDIRLRYNGKAAIDPNDELVIEYKVGRVTESKPVAWQEKGNVRQPVTALFRKIASDEVGFAVSGWDGRSTLVIDPVLKWNTFLGSANDELSDLNNVSIDSSGNVYVCGYGFVTWGSPVRAYTGGGDVFVAKIDSDGNLLWNTFLGGTGAENDHGIAVDSSGNVVIVGHSTSSWGSPVRAYTGGEDAFAAKLDADGNLLWNTFLGGSAGDRGMGIVVDNAGNSFLTGYSNTTWGNPVHPYTGDMDAFVAELDSSGNLNWNTFIGGISGERAEGIVVDGAGNSFIVGYSNSTWGSPVRAYTANADIFVARIDNNGNPQWNTFLGGNGAESPGGIALDTSENIFISGYSDTSWGSPIRAYSAGYDVMAAKLDSSGNLLWNTFLGGSGNDTTIGGGIAIDAKGDVLLSGGSSVSWGSPSRAFTGGWDAFAAKLNGSGSLLWNAFLGGNLRDSSYGLAVDDATGNIYMSGYSEASWGNPVRGFSGNFDIFAAMFRLPAISGNTGTGEVTLSYNDGGAKTATSDSSGHYSISVSDNWNGTITPAKAGYVFIPANRVYSNITADQTGQDYIAT